VVFPSTEQHEKIQEEKMKFKNTKNQIDTIDNEQVDRDSSLKSVQIDLKDDDRIVPTVIYAFRDGERIEDLNCEVGIGVNVQPIDNAVRVLIRPDLTKQQALEILYLIAEIVSNDDSDWHYEVDRFLDDFRREVEKKNMNIAA